jgi:hypothetical protein
LHRLPDGGPQPRPLPIIDVAVHRGVAYLARHSFDDGTGNVGSGFTMLGSRFTVSGSSFSVSGSRFIMPISVFMRVSCHSFGFFACQKRRFVRRGDSSSSLFTFGPWKLISGKPHHAWGGAEARGNLKLRREVADHGEEDDPAGFGAVGVETAFFTSGMPTLQCVMTSP